MFIQYHNESLLTSSRVFTKTYTGCPIIIAQNLVGDYLYKNKNSSFEDIFKLINFGNTYTERPGGIVTNCDLARYTMT